MKTLVLTSLLGLLICLPSAAAETIRLENSERYGTSRETLDSLVIRSIVIDNRNIYDTRDEDYDQFFYKAANKLHYRTRKSVIERELLFNVGDKFSEDLLAETARNLRSRLSIYDAWIEVTVRADGVHVTVVTVDQWSFASGVSIRREGNETSYRLSVEETNLLGNNQLLSLDYILGAEDGDYLTSSFADSRILGRPYRFAWVFSGNRVAGGNHVVFGHPYYSLSQICMYDVAVGFNSGRRDQYDDTLKVAESGYEGEYVSTAFAYRMGSYRKKIRIGTSYKYRFERISDRRPLPGRTDITFPSDSVYHQFGLDLRGSAVSFIKLQRIDGFGYTEDFTLGATVSAGISRAFRPGLDSHLFDVLEFRLGHGLYAGESLIMLTGSNSYWFKSGRALRQLTGVTAQYYGRMFSFLTLAFNGQYLSDWDRDGSERLVVGGSSGVRGVDKFYQTGNRRVLVNIEGRFFPGINILSAIIGAAAFTDIGRAWKTGESVNFDDPVISAGAGLRLYLERFLKDKVLRFDFAYSERGRWEISVGADQYFRVNKSTFLLTNL